MFQHQEPDSYGRYSLSCRLILRRLSVRFFYLWSSACRAHFRSPRGCSRSIQVLLSMGTGPIACEIPTIQVLAKSSCGVVDISKSSDQHAGSCLPSAKTSLLVFCFRSFQSVDPPRSRGPNPACSHCSIYRARGIESRNHAIPSIGLESP
jgi:hypothetical protein